MATPIMSANRADPSDAQLIDVAVLLLDTVPGDHLGVAPLSHVLQLACASSSCGASCETRAEDLAAGLACYLHDRHILKTADATVAGLDAWAASAPLTVVRTAVAAYARHRREVSGRPPSTVTGPDLLTFAAALLPCVVSCGHPMCCDLHTAFYETARTLRTDTPAEA